MEVSKLSVSPETLRFQRIGKGRKTKLRRQNIIDLIESKPYGTPITLAEFSTVAQLSTGSAHSLIKTMVKHGVISKDKLEGKGYGYRVNGAVWVTKKPEKVRPAPDITEAIRLAREFYWQTASNDLHEFVVWLEQRGAA